MKAIACIVFALAALAMAQKKMPEMPCTFSTRYIETMTYRASASPMSRIYGALRSNVASRRAQAVEALKSINSGSDADVPKFGDYQDDLMWYMAEGQAGAQIEDNVTYIWQAPYTFTLISPFFDRYTCVKLLSSGTPPIHCPEFADRSEVKFDRVDDCPNRKGQKCDVWTWWSYDYSVSQEAFMVTGTNILDLVDIETEDYSLREDFINMTTDKPDPSHFNPPKTIPCTDLVSDPEGNGKMTWARKEYPGKKFPMKSLASQMAPRRHRTVRSPRRPVFVGAVPETFDARQQWPQCPTIQAIRDQGHCGSCWAFGAAESFGDRYCITTGSHQSFSPQHLVDCFDDENGCMGGSLDTTWYAMVKKGIVPDECKPYTAVSHECSIECNDTQHSKPTYYYAKNAYSVFVPFDNAKNVRAIQEEILAHGPVEAAFYVVDGFTQYSGGVYQRTAGAEYQGGHAIKIIGWGVDQDTKVPYWLIANSWGEDWGEKGFFRIRRGYNECGIESEIATGLISA